MRMEPVEANGCTQSLLDRLASLVGQRFQTHVKARVIIQHRQCMGTPAWVDRGSLKSICQRLLGIRARSAASWAWLEDWARSVSMKKRVMVLEPGCAFPSVLMQAADLACSPARMALAQIQNSSLCGLRQLYRTSPGTARLICQSFAALLAVSAEPLVAGLSLIP